MNPRQIELVQTSFEKVVPIAGVAADLFYNRLFELDPSLRPMFKGDLTEQKVKLMQMLTAVARGLNRIEQLVPAVQQLGRRHGAYGVQNSHYATVAAALLWTLEQGLGPDFTPEVKEAWVAAYTLLATTMQAAAAEGALSAMTAASTHHMPAAVAA
jgi:hemoglobin-like flavoprotein